MACHGDGCQQGSDEDSCDLGYDHCLKLGCRCQESPYSLFPGLWTISWQQSTQRDLHAQDPTTRIILISITYPFHGTGSVAYNMVVMTISQSVIQVRMPKPRTRLKLGHHPFSEVKRRVPHTDAVWATRPTCFHNKHMSINHCVNKFQPSCLPA